jgi:hypothetical protein
MELHDHAPTPVEIVAVIVHNRLSSRTRSPARRTISRYPSCLISCTQKGPVGTTLNGVGRHGSNNPGRPGGVRQRMSPGIIALHNDSESFLRRRNRLTGNRLLPARPTRALPPPGDGRSSPCLGTRPYGRWRFARSVLRPDSVTPAVALWRPPSDRLAYPDGSWSPALQLALNAAMANSLFRKRNEHILGLKPLT